MNLCGSATGRERLDIRQGARPLPTIGGHPVGKRQFCPQSERTKTASM
jgi:hypothetical protein